MILRWFSSFVTTLVFMVRHHVEGDPPGREPRRVDVDCPDHGPTTLRDTRRTECCNSLMWVPSGKVKSRACTKRAGRRRRNRKTLICRVD